MIKVKYIILLIAVNCYAADVGSLKPNWQYEMYIDGLLACEYKPSDEYGMVYNVPMIKGKHTIELKQVMPLNIVPVPTAIPMLQTTLPEKIQYDNAKYMVINFDIIEPKNNVKMDIYTTDTDNCFLALRANHRYSSNDYKQWALLMVPKQEASGTCRILMSYLYNGYVDKRLIYIENL